MRTGKADKLHTVFCTGHAVVDLRRIPHALDGCGYTYNQSHQVHKEYRDKTHLMFYTNNILKDSNLTFHKCWQEGEVMGIYTHVNLENRLI
jgi:hypothetical protein